MSFSMARDIADVIKDLGIEIILGYPGEPNIILQGPYKRTGGWSQKEMIETEVRLTGRVSDPKMQVPSRSWRRK